MSACQGFGGRTCLCVISRTPRTISSRLAPGGKSRRTRFRRGGRGGGSAGGFGGGAGALSCGEVIGLSAAGIRKFQAEDGEVLAKLKAAGVKLINETPFDGAYGCRVAFVHPAATEGILLELSEKNKS